MQIFVSIVQFSRCVGGDEEVRTPDPLRARQVLSQLSYTPVFQGLGLPLHLFKLLKFLSESSKLNNKLLPLTLLTEDLNILLLISP